MKKQGPILRQGFVKRQRIFKHSNCANVALDLMTDGHVDNSYHVGKRMPVSSNCLVIETQKSKSNAEIC